MLLILSNSRDATVDYLAPILRQNGIEFLRFDTDTALQDIQFHYAAGRPILRFERKEYHPSQFGTVWYRRPEELKAPFLDSSPESKFIGDEWAEALEGFFAHISLKRWINHPSCNFCASHKLEQLSSAQSIGLLVPDTLVTHDEQQLLDFAARHPRGIITKPMATGYVKRPDDQMDSLIYTNVVSADHLSHLDDLGTCPTLFQELIEKRSDVRINILDYTVHAVELIAKEADGAQRCDIRRNNMDDVAYRPIAIPRPIQEKLMALLVQYNLRFAAIDMAITVDGQWYFFEINPNGQWAWLDLVAGTNIADAFVDVLGAE